MALGYKNTRQGLATNVMNEDKGVHSVDTPSGTQQMTIINESGLYALIFGSKLESAKRFKHWVTSDVLPAIRKTGSYKLNPYQNDRGIIVQPCCDIEPPKLDEDLSEKAWFFRNNKRMQKICNEQNMERKTLYHFILLDISTVYDFKQAETIYTLHHGYPPKYVMDVVGYFTHFQKIADEYLDRLESQIDSNII